MKRYWGQVLAGIAVTAVACTVMPACVHDDSTFFIRGVLAPPTAQPGQGCTYTTDPTQAQLIGGGTLDIALASSSSDSYRSVFLCGNQIIAQGNSTAPQTESSRIVIQGAVVRITDATGVQLASFTTLSNGFVDPPNGNAPSYGVVQFTSVDPATTALLRSQLGPFARRTVITYTKAFGTTLGGQHVESNEYEFPVTVCYGCLVSGLFSLAPGSPPTCNGAPPSTASAACFFGQDQLVDCHACSDALCNGTAAPPPVDGGAG